MGYVQYGIDRTLVESVKKKLKKTIYKERLKKLFDGVSKTDLQDRSKVRKLLQQAAKALGENINAVQEERIVHFVLEQKIDPANTFHLIRLWGVFR